MLMTMLLSWLRLEMPLATAKRSRRLGVAGANAGVAGATAAAPASSLIGERPSAPRILDPCAPPAEIENQRC